MGLGYEVPFFVVSCLRRLGFGSLVAFFGLGVGLKVSCLGVGARNFGRGLGLAG